MHRVKLGKETGCLLSSDVSIRPEENRVRWTIEVFFRDARGIMPRGLPPQVSC